MTVTSEGSSPTSSSHSNSSNSPENKSQKAAAKESSDDTESEKKAAPISLVSGRSKRLIHYQKLDFSAAYVKHFGTAGGDEDEDDEDFVLKDDDSSAASNDDDDDREDDEQDDDENSSDEDDEDEEKKPRKMNGGGESSSVNSSQNSASQNHETADKMDTESGDKEKKKSRGRPKKPATSANQSQETNQQLKQEPNDDKSDNNESKQESVKKKRKRRSKKLKTKNEEELDEETRKILGSFKTAQIVTKQPRRKRTATNGGGKASSSKEAPTSLVESRSGPYVKLNKQTLPNNNIEYATYVVKSSETKESLAASAAAAGGIDLGGGINHTYKQLVPRDRAAPVRDPTRPARCSMCDNEANCVPELGDLFGPYRVSADFDTDLFIDDQQIDDKEFHEVWLHEGCALWSPNLFIKNNRLIGVASAVKAAQDMKCVYCKKSGASLSCRNVECNRIYHYLCALKTDCLFNEESFSILCKTHSTKRTKLAPIPY